MKVTSILMVGVGGQGIVLASNVLCKAAMYAGFDVKKSEIHGMAQRGGSVVSHVRFGKEVFSPAIPEGSADFIMSFEEMEYLRYTNYVGVNCTLIQNYRRILPPTVATGAEKYPEALIEAEKKRFSSFFSVDAEAKAVEAGNSKTAGTVLLGVLANLLGIEEELWFKALEDTVPVKVQEVNITAFKLGINAGK